MNVKSLVACVLVFWSAAASHAGTVLVHRNAGWQISDWKFRLGNATPAVPEGWQQPDFDDRAWPVGKSAFGYGEPVRYGTVLKEMKGAASTIYLRTSFLVSDRSKLSRLFLDVNYSGGFVAWINGVQVAARNAPTALSPDAKATASRQAGPGDYESFLLASPTSLVRDGTNVLAIQALSADRDAGRFLIDAGLIDTHSLAHNRPTFASSVGSGPHRDKQFMRAFNAVDGSQISFFASDLLPPQWFYIDLGEPQMIDKVRYHWWGDRQPRDFEIQISNDAASWTAVHTGVNAPRSVRTEATFKPASARYVRVQATRTMEDKNALFFSLCEVFAPGVDFEPTEFASLATGRPATASSETKPRSFHGAAEMAVNGHALSWWTSQPGDPQWLAVDLGTRQPINRVRLHAKENVKAFKIQISDDGTTWNDVATREAVTRIAAGDVKAIFDLHFAAEMQARHVRFFGTARDNPEHGYGLAELAVYRDKAFVPLPAQ